MLYFLICILTVSAEVNFRYISNITYTEPTYCFLKDLLGNGKQSLIMNRFKPFGKGTVSIIKDIESAVTSGGFGSAKIEKLFDDLFWPNWVEQAPAGIWKDKVSMIVPDGFILPGTTPGEMYVLGLDENLDISSSASLTGSKWNPSDYGQFYTLGEFHDLKRPDGKLDILATKGRDIFGPVVQPQSTHLVMLQQPEDPTQQWKEILLAEGPDFAFTTKLFPDGEHMAIFTGSFFYSKLSYYILDMSNYPPSLSKEFIIDTNVGHVYSVQLVDLNNDGKVELMVNNHEENNATLAGVYVYTLPENMYEWSNTASYKRKQIASGFVPYAKAPGKAAPGFPILFWPTPDKSTIPHIFVQGDDDGGYYHLEPTSSNFDYTQTLIRQFQGTVGYPAVGDIDNDGYPEFFLPDYDHDVVHFYTLCPHCSYH